MGTSSNSSTLTANLRLLSGGTWSTLTGMTLSDYGTVNGFTTNVSPLFSLGSGANSGCVLGIQLMTTTSSNISTKYRIGTVTLAPVT